MKAGIQYRADIEKLVDRFYETVKTDKTIGFIFTGLVQVDWETHIPLIVDFWETILLDNPVYKHNAMQVHYALNKKFPLQKTHFESWLKCFVETVDELFAGKTAELAKTRARSVAGVMLFKMNNQNNKQSII